MHGALLVDKPSGPTSHDVVAIARRALKTPAIGHTGTLDPLATGLLVLLVGHATRLARFLVTDEKEYIAHVRLGQSTPTYDAQSLDEVRGPRSEVRGPTAEITEDRIRAVLPEFLGTFPQLPPAFSAKKVGGVRAYEKARRKEDVDLKPVEVTVRELDLLSFEPVSDVGRRASDVGRRTSDVDDRGLVRLRVAATAGFYVRSLAHDIGQLLGCGAHLEALRRTRAGQFNLADAITLDALRADGIGAEDRLLGLNSLLPGMPAVTLTEEGKRRALNGNTLAPGHLEGPVSGVEPGRNARVLDSFGTLVSVAEMRPDGLLHPLLVLR